MATMHRVEVPGVVGELEIEEPGAFRGMTVRHRGQTLAKKSLFSRTYLVPREDGTSAELEIWLDGLRGVVHVRGAGLERVLGEPIPTWLALVAAVPIVLAFVGGGLGGLIGALTWMLNRAVASRRELHPLVRLGAMAVLTGVGAMAWIVVATAFSLALHH